MGAAPPALEGVTIGENLASVVRRPEFPKNSEMPTVVNTDIGHVWSWTEKDGTLERLTTDDDGVVQMIEILASGKNHKLIDVPVAGSLQFNESGHINANDRANPDLFRDEWLPLANMFGTVLGYAIEPNYGVVFGFPAGDGGLIEVATGTRDALYTTGLIPRKTMISASPLLPRPAHGRVYKAPKLVWRQACNEFRDPTAFVRVAVRSDGVPSAATIFLGNGYPNPAPNCEMYEKFRPATLNGKPVPSVYFQR